MDWVKDNKGDKIYAAEAQDNLEYNCYYCKELVIRKRRRNYYFSHYKGIKDCPASYGYTDGDTKKMQLAIANALFDVIGEENIKFNCEVKDSLGQKYLAHLIISCKGKKPFIIQCQAKLPKGNNEKQQLKKWQVEAHAFNEVGYSVLWLWHPRRLGLKAGRLFSWGPTTKEQTTGVKLPPETELCYKLCNNIYGLDNEGNLASIRFGGVLEDIRSINWATLNLEELPDKVQHFKVSTPDLDVILIE